MNIPSEDTRVLIDALRDELQEYGALLHDLKDQQRCLVRRQPEQVLALSETIERQLVAVGRTRQRHLEAIRALVATGNAAPPSSPIVLTELLPYFHASVAPMVRALIEEINRLIAQAGRLTHQNQMLLARAVESTRAALQAVQPGDALDTYSPKGKVLTGLTNLPAGGKRCLA